MEFLNEKPDVMMDELHAVRRLIQKEYEERGEDDAIAWYHQQALQEAEKNGYSLIPDSHLKGLFKFSLLDKKGNDQISPGS